MRRLEPPTRAPPAVAFAFDGVHERLSGPKVASLAAP